MKILFVCMWNAERSQMAEAFARKLLKGHQVSSAGTHARWSLFKAIPRHVPRLMKEAGFDMDGQYRKQLTPEMMEQADKVIMITKKFSWPGYVKKSPKVIFWNISDPWILPMPYHVRAREKIREKITELKKEIG